MITLQEIIPWRATAPWANDLMVEQDYLLSQAVELIFKDQNLSRQLAMRGGTVLHKGHLAPSSRYSEDIDLVLVANRSHKGIREDLTAVLKPLLGLPVESLETTVRLAVRNLVSKSKIARLVYPSIWPVERCCVDFSRLVSQLRGHLFGRSEMLGLQRRGPAW